MRLKYSDIQVNIISDLKNVIGNEYKLVGIRPYYQYVDKVKSETVEGYNYEIVLMERGYEKISVKIPGRPLLTELNEDSFSSGVSVHFKDLDYRVYAKASNDFVSYNLTLTAKGIDLDNVPKT